MAFRDDLSAAQARADALERDLAAAEKDNQALRQQLEGEVQPRGDAPRRPRYRSLVWLTFVVAAGVAVVALTTGVIFLLPVVALLLFLGVGMLIVERLIIVVRPDQIAVVSGRPHRRPDGTIASYRVVRGGRVVKLPFLETVDFLDAGVHSVNGEIRRAYAKGGIPVDVKFCATIKVSDAPREIANAAERFIGRSSAEMVRVARETIEGTLRAVVASHDLEALRSDLLLVAQQLMSEVGDDLARLGLTIEHFSLESIEPEAG